MTARLRPLAAMAAGAAALALTACSVPVPEPTATPSPEAHSALLQHQAERISRLTFEEVTAADDAQDAGFFDARVGEIVEEIRAAEYVVAAKGGADPDVLPSEIQAFYTTDSDTWPRALVAVTVAADATHTPVVLTWVQDGPGDPYELRAWAHMVPGGVLSAMPEASVGAAQLPLDATGFTLTPAEAIDQYVALLNEGGDGELDAVFAPDPYREGMFEARTALDKKAKAQKGEYTDTVTARVEDSFVLADAEGGALVFLRLEVVSDASVSGGAKLTLNAGDKALLTGTLGSRVVYRYEDLVVIRLWAEGVEVLPTVIAADHHLVGIATS
ncbi:MAG: hypothetical protein JW722_03690 [Demequinaceae bacterium]|nr:hypothetical protein [Demequinaceae bacterium]